MHTIWASSTLLYQEFFYRNRGKELVDVLNQNGRPLLTGGGNTDASNLWQILIDQIQDHSICKESTQVYNYVIVIAAATHLDCGPKRCHWPRPEHCQHLHSHSGDVN